MRGGRGTVLIDRPRIRDRLGAAPLVVLEAPGGYGKSTAWAQHAAFLDVATIRVVLRGSQTLTGLLASIALGCRRAGLSVLADAIDTEDPDGSLDRWVDRVQAGRPVLLAIDEVQRVAPAGAEWLATLADDIPEGTHLALAGRRLAPAIAQLSNRTDAVWLGAADLRFDLAETEAVLSTRPSGVHADEAASVLAATDGWPAAIVLAAVRPSSTKVPGAVESGADVLRSLVDRLLDAAGSATRDLAAAAAGLPLLSGEVLDSIGGAGALDRLLETGLPIHFRPDGWAELPDPVRELFPTRMLSVDQSRGVAELYADGGELSEAVALLHRAGDHEGLADLLARQTREALERAGLPLCDAVLSDSPDAVLAARPQALISLVRAAERQPRLRAKWLERGLRVFPHGTAPRRAMEAEQAVDVVRSGELERAGVLANEVLTTAGGDELVTRGRAQLARALSEIVSDTASGGVDAAHELELAIGLFMLAGERGWEAESHQALGFGVHYPDGAFGAATEHLERALALRPAADSARAGTLTYLAELLTQTGRLDDAAIAVREAAAIGHRLGDARSIAYAAWSAADLACQNRDAPGAFAALEEAEANPEGWFERLGGIDFLTHASEMRTILGDADGARRDLARAEARATGTALEGITATARARLEIMLGDPQEGLRQLDALDKSPFVYRSGRWLRLLERAACMARLGDEPAAAVLVQRSRHAAAELGDPERLERREPELLAMAVPGQAVESPAHASVVLLGGFAVERGGTDVSPPPGRPQTLVKLLSVTGKLTTDEAIDILWPEADLDTGRARLRNLLNRIRASSGVLIDRSDGGLSLAAGVSVDATLFEREAAAALSAPPEERVSLARSALVRSTGELLPTDRYAEWSVVPRERLRRRYLALLDIVADDAVARGDLDEADQLLDAAISTEPLEEERYVRLGRALLAQGRTRQAQRVADQGVAVCTDLGVDPGPNLARLLAELAQVASGSAA